MVPFASAFSFRNSRRLQSRQLALDLSDPLLVAPVERPLLDPLAANEPGPGKHVQVLAGGGLADAELARDVDTADAVRQASLTLIRDRRSKGQSTNPFYWAAFVAAGDWR